MSVQEMIDLEVVHRFSQALQEVDRVAAMRRPSRARRNVAMEAATNLRLELGHRITAGTFAAWHRLGIADSADNGERRQAGRGTVYHDRSRDRWVAELTVNGKRHRKVVPTQTAAEAWLEVARQRLESGQDADGPTWTVETWLERCVNELWPVSLSPTTLEMHRHAAERWRVPVLGQRRLKTVTPSDVQTVITSMTDAGLSPNTVRINTATMGKAMRQAVVDDIVTRNVVSLAQRPKIENVRESKYLTPDQARRALAHASEDHLYGDAVALGNQ